MSFELKESDIDDYIEQVRLSGVFGRSARRLRLLDHLLRAELLGQGDKLKAYSIGLDIFNKSEDFDPAADSIVRVEIGRLRSALSIFEASEFAQTNILVEIPVGTYRPAITQRDPDKAPEQLEGEASALTEPKSDDAKKAPGKRPAVYVGAVIATIFALALWFGLEKSQEHSRPAIGVQVAKFGGLQELAPLVTSGLQSSLSRSAAITLLMASNDGSIHEDAGFLVSGQVVNLQETLQVIASLREIDTDRIVWTKSLHVEKAADLSGLVERKIGNELRVRLFGASKDHLANLNPQLLDPEALFVLSTWVPGVATNAIAWEKSRIDYAQLALKKDPDFGAAHSVLADKLAYLANVYKPANSKENLDRAAWHGRRALELAPLDPDVVFNAAQSLWHSGKISQSQVAMKRVLELDPGHDLARFLDIVIAYSCAVAPDDVVEDAIAFDAALSADNPIRWLTLTWIGWLHAYRGEWIPALRAEERAALIFEIPYAFMRHAMILNQLGRPEDARKVVERQSKNWAGFDPEHFADTTIPRLCSEETASRQFEQLYVDLVDTLLADR